ncbi:hypothetical protein DL93DRAFT_2094356 [Clavulina sp. PMI_390]|nr:hypothetical protein DL93DRAFT_2094356 [Clavulina sp. PMI_390]
MPSERSKLLKDEDPDALPLRKTFVQGYIWGGTVDMPPHLHKLTLLFFPFYLSLIPVARVLTRPTGLFSLALDKFVGPRTPKSIAVLIGLGFFNTYLLSATGSVYAQSTTPRGYQNQTPRLTKEKLRGVYHRLVSAHQSLLETFPGFGLAALLVLFTHSSGMFKGPVTPLIDGLFLAFFCKQIIFPIAYIAGEDFTRSNAHILSVSSQLYVLWDLITAL